ncbi:SDR family oxidoreductase [Pseudoalteromonas fuliginea]|uniref:SDR family NAD(P)-dependent oxidoreductase n=1 Tax=Pseudoalteromonas TaxID=53246 RepID=UPI0002316212|nr:MULTISPECIES: SDR family oxidoreductase [unclassified Pseudoalteromonas]ALQ10010.1 short-chain dehydrogenase [Pseudoalteromonas sp. Bsw20308]ATG79667.1 short-chain dehydrogenase [Pseudoalteromonas sp. 1_2015MBL_MicDiv]MBB1297498.1 SDR family oxidoreductase [Pseudoalteromonas sp. SR41-7]MDQ2044720.1 SDR family oxidoreductase [Pseudoalteromonas sp. 20-92]GAA78450.1 3-ketoacyl-CoA reductase [Pseudoalteromonas sp. BSi20495]
MKKLNLENTNILITGASSGIGKEFAKQLASKGANLILTARTHSDLISLAQELEREHRNIWIKTIPADLSELNGPKKLFEQINDLGLSVDYLINNAGFGKFCEFSGESFETYHKMLMLNVNALVELTHLCLPAMVNKNSGGIINVASIGSFQPLPYQTVYGASKAFVLSFSEALTGELLDKNIRVMALCPGTTESRFMENANADTSNMNLAPASKVVKSALAAYEKNRMYTVSGKINYVVSLIPRLFSRKRTVKIVVSMFKDNVLGKSLV